MNSFSGKRFEHACGETSRRRTKGGGDYGNTGDACEVVQVSGTPLYSTPPSHSIEVPLKKQPLSPVRERSDDDSASSIGLVPVSRLSFPPFSLHNSQTRLHCPAPQAPSLTRSGSGISLSTTTKSVRARSSRSLSIVRQVEETV